MHQAKPRDNAALRLSKTLSHDRSGGEGRVVKKCKGTPKHNSKIEKLRKIFESSPTRGRAELLTQLSQPICKQINFNLSGQTTTTESVGLTQKICVGQPEEVTGTGLGRTVNWDQNLARIGQHRPARAPWDQSDRLLERTRSCGKKEENGE